MANLTPPQPSLPHTIAILLLLSTISSTKLHSNEQSRLYYNWSIQAESRITNSSGQNISSATSDCHNWFRNISVPSNGTVLAGLISVDFFKHDLFVSDNLKTRVNSTMFDEPWWFRKEFRFQLNITSSEVG